LMLLSKRTQKELSKFLVGHLLLTKKLERETRLNIWLKYAEFNTSPKKEKNHIFTRSSDNDIREQIEVDIVRTKQWRGKEYQEVMRNLLMDYFFVKHTDFEYFQGFNYIVSFFYDFFQNEDNTSSILEHISQNIIFDFFQEKLCQKLNLIHFQTNKILEKIYPQLTQHWKIIDLYSEILFSSFFISLFTSITQKDMEFICQFWDVIFVKKWVGVLECIFFIIDLFYDDLMKLGNNQTLRFFTQLKNSEELFIRASKNDFKEFRKTLIFDKLLFEDLEDQYFIIKEKIT
jgi:hypothetical protein